MMLIWQSVIVDEAEWWRRHKQSTKTLQQKASCLLKFVRSLPQKIENSKKMFSDQTNDI